MHTHTAKTGWNSTMPPNESSSKTGYNRSQRYGRRLANPKPGEEIVISGLSAKFPSCNNAYEIRENLDKKLDLITGECRWIFESSAMPARVGYIPGADLFDCSAFGEFCPCPPPYFFFSVVLIFVRRVS